MSLSKKDYHILYLTVIFWRNLMESNFAIYTHEPQTITEEEINLLLPNLKISVEKNFSGDISSFFIKHSAFELQLNIMPEIDLEDHLQGFAGYLLHITDHESYDNAPEELKEFLNYIVSLKKAYGCVSSGPVNDEAIDFLLKLTAQLDGIYFYNDSVYDSDGDVLIGP